jgi:hypothetical protein
VPLQRNANAHSNGYTNYDSYRECNLNTHINCNSYCNSYNYRYCHSNTHTNSDTRT